jgi:hypothetical protein
MDCATVVATVAAVTANAEIDITHHDAVEAYAWPLSTAPGATVGLHVRCTTERYDVTVERWGATREVVWSASDLPGEVPFTPADADAHGCGWPVSVEVPVGVDWRSGYHHVTVRAHGAPADRAVAHACFVVRAGVARADTLLVLATNTWNAYNSWGGRSLYTGGHEVSFQRPFGRGFLERPEVERDDRKSWPPRWGEEADVDGMIYQRYRLAAGYAGFVGSSGWFTFERRFVEWAEGDGFAFDMAVSSDLEQQPDLLDGYDLVLGVGHDEYWSAAGRDTVEAYVREGGTYASLSGNTMFWQVRLTPIGSMVCHKYRAHLDDPVVAEGRPTAMTGMWCDPVVARPETAFLGASSAYGLYARFGRAVARGAGAFTVFRDDHWLFAGTDLRYGDLLGARDGVVGYETVGCPITLDEHQLPVARADAGAPADIDIVAWAPSSNLRVGEYPASIAALDDQGDLELIAERLYGRLDDDAIARVRHGNAVMAVGRPFGAAGGEVITVGSTDWVFGLAADEAVAQVTRNVLARVRPRS